MDNSGFIINEIQIGRQYLTSTEDNVNWHWVYYKMNLGMSFRKLWISLNKLI